MSSLSLSVPAPLRRVAIQPLPWLLIALIASLPFLSWLRFAPNGDWVANAAALLLAAVLVLLGGGRMAPALRLSPALAMVAALTLATLPPLAASPYPGAALALLAVLWLAALLAQAVAAWPRERVLLALACGLLLGGLLQLALGALQVLQLVRPLGLWFVIDAGGQLFGNIAQRNQYANYLTLSLLAACWLYATGRLRVWLLVPLVALLALFMAWSASRLVLAYGIGIALLAWGMLRLVHRAGGDARCETARMAGALALAVLVMALCQLFTAEINAVLQALGLPVGLQSGADRWMAGGFGARRWIEWQKAWQVFAAHPLAGVGFGGYAAQSVALEPAFAGQWSESWLFTHCHNIVLQLLAETGLTGTLAVAAGLLWAFLPWFRRENTGVDALLVLGLALVLLGHSLLEYPLWYASFLMVFAVLLGVTPAAGWTLPVRASLRRIGTLLLLGLLLWQTVLGTMYYFDWVKWVFPASEARENKARVEALLVQGANPVWSYDADQLLSNYLDGDAAHLALKLPLFERLAAYRPYPGTLLKLAMLRAHAGDGAGGRLALQQAIAAYPDAVPRLAAALAQDKSPALDGLRAMARRAEAAFAAGQASAAARTVRQ